MSLRGKTVLVTGATGFLGGALARRLAADGAVVRAMARRPNRDRYIRDVPGIELVTGDVTQPESLPELMDSCEIVFHVAAALGGKLHFQRRVNVEGTRNVIHAAANANVKRIVYISSIAAYGFRYRGDISEDMPPNPNRDPYNVTKAEAEAVIKVVASETGLAYTIIRPGMIYGPRGGMWTGQMFRLARGRPTIFIGDGSGSAYPIHVDDVVDLCVIAAIHPAAKNEIFNCTPDPSPTWRDYLGGYSRLAGHDQWFGIPVWMARIAAPLIEGVLMLRGEPKDVPDLLSYSQTMNTYKMDKARELLGWQPKIGLEEGIADCAEWLRSKGLLQ